MDLISIIKGRRSTRSYKEEQIDEKSLQEIMEAAIHAPNATNQQKWHFSVIRDRASLDRYVEVIKENIDTLNIEFLKERTKNPDYHTFHRAPTVIMISGEEGNKFVQIDCGAAAQTICLAAESLGISSCVIGSSALLFEAGSGSQMKKEIGIPENYSHICSVALGYRKGDKPESRGRDRDVINFVK